MKNDRHIPWILLEDEYYTAGELKRLVGRVSSKYHNIAIIDTCKRFREYWRRSPNADLIITDESLADGPVTGVLEDLEVKTPVIVVTSNEERRPQDFSGKDSQHPSSPGRVISHE